MSMTMSLEVAFKRLAIRPVSICRQCCKSIATSAPKQQEQQQFATAAVAASLQSSRPQNSQPYRPLTATTNSAPPPAPPSTAAAPSSSASQYNIANAAIRESSAGRREQANKQAIADLRRTYTRKDLEAQATRKWIPGDVYAPHDLSGVEMSKWKKMRRKPKSKYDIMDQLAMNPLHHYRNFSIMSEYITEMGRIRHSNDTGLRPVNQRKMAKAVRRAMGIGLMPGVHRHPEILRLENERRAAGQY